MVVCLVAQRVAKLDTTMVVKWVGNLVARSVVKLVYCWVYWRDCYLAEQKV